jgi:prevent-host-death family protein
MQVTIHEAKTHLSRLIQKALDGEEVIIAKRNQPLIKLVTIPPDSQTIRFGGLADTVLSMDDTFDDELEDFSEYRPQATSFVAESESAPYGTSED